MTNKQIDNRVKKLQALEARQKELEARAKGNGEKKKGGGSARREAGARPGRFPGAGRGFLAKGVATRPLKQETPEFNHDSLPPTSPRRFSIA